MEIAREIDRICLWLGYLAILITLAATFHCAKELARIRKHLNAHPCSLCERECNVTIDDPIVITRKERNS